MPTANHLIETARKYIGETEYPPNSNKVIFNTNFYGREVSGPSYPWCAVFVYEMCKEANVHLPIKTASCTALMNAAKQADMWVVSNFKPGDIVIFDFSGQQKTAKHVGIVEEVLPDYGVQSIEGNTSSNDSGSQDNGGMVCRKTRRNKYIIGAVRPAYDPETIEQEDVSKMTIAEFVEKLTDEQAYTLLTKAQRHAGTLAEPKWSINEGHWEKAKNSGVINGGSPEGLIKRDEVIAILGRKGLL